MKIEKFVFNVFQVNTYLIYDDSGEGLLIDPSCNSSKEKKELETFIFEKAIKIMAIVNTHGHVDHLPGVAYFKEKYEIPFYMSQEDEFLLSQAQAFGAGFGMEIEKPPIPDFYLKEGEILKFGAEQVEIIHVPGHSPGSMVIYSSKSKILITGDVLFAGSIGRTDLPGGNYDQLIDGIKNKLLIFANETKVFPGHGPATTIGKEKELNPFLN